MKKQVALGMSGGIDSSVAAFLLKNKKYEVIGFTLKLWDEGSRCCDIADITRAQNFAHYLGIKHYVIDLQKEFKQYVIDYFIKEYREGKTPNPCVVCNQEIKFNYLYNKLKEYNLDYIATGHYAKIKRKNREYFFTKAKDKKKSQEYFLATINKKLLPKIIFPLGSMTKEEVKKIASTIDFQFRDNESQEVCFIQPGTNYYDFIVRQSDKNDYSGNIINKEHKILGKHNSFFQYTIGQRQGLGISDATPYYVIGIDAKEKNVIVGKKEDVYKRQFSVENIYWYTKYIKPKIILKVKIRYNHKEAEAMIISNENFTTVEFKEPQYAITPGQLAVFYKGDLVLGSVSKMYWFLKKFKIFFWGC